MTDNYPTEPYVPGNPVSDHPAAQPVETLEQKLTRWYTLKAQVADLTAQEATLRTEIATAAFPDAKKEKGSQRKGIGYGKDLKLTTSMRHTIDRAAFEAAKGGLAPELLDTLVRYKPEVVESGLNAISDPKVKALVGTFITSRPGLPQLEIVDVKKR